MIFTKLNTYRKTLNEIKHEIENLSIRELESLDITSTNEIDCVKGYVVEGECYKYDEREEHLKSINKDLKEIENKYLKNKIVTIEDEFDGKKFTYNITFSPSKIVFSSTNDVIRRANKKKELKTLRILDIINLEEVIKNLENDYKEYLIEIKSNLILEATKLVRSDKYKDVYQKMINAGEFDKYTYYHIVNDRKEFLRQIGFSEEELKKHDIHTEENCYGHTCGITTSIDFKNKIINIVGYSSDD